MRCFKWGYCAEPGVCWCDAGHSHARQHLPCMQAASTAPATLPSPLRLPPPAVSLPLRPPADAPGLPEQVYGGDVGDYEEAASSDEAMFTERDWENVLLGYTSQHVEHDYWIPESMIEGAGPL